METMLIRLHASHCKIDSLETIEFPNLRHLDLSWNLLETVDMQSLQLLHNLQVLVLAHNPLTTIASSVSDYDCHRLQTLDLSYTRLEEFGKDDLGTCFTLKTLNISYAPVTGLGPDALENVDNLEVLDLTGSPVLEYEDNVFKHLKSLRLLYTENYRLCCSVMLPDDFEMRQGRCYSKADLVASCDDLLKSNVYRVFLCVMAVLSLLGNFASFGWRIYFNRSKMGSFGIFVTNLTIADFCMGVYLVIIFAADLSYRGIYVSRDLQWKRSAYCSLAGFLSFLSNEVSVINTCLITIDRILVLRFPFSQFRFKFGSACVACAFSWLAGGILALIPLLPSFSYWNFYSQTGICIPLPLVQKHGFPGYMYSFSVTIIFNFLLFVGIAVGQVFIYLTIQAQAMKAMWKDSKSKDATIATRLVSVALSDFCCWFPIGLLGILSFTNVYINSELNIAVAIFALPFNSALNPFLYTFNVLLEMRNKKKEASLLRRLELQLKLEQRGKTTSSATQWEIKDCSNSAE